MQKNEKNDAYIFERRKKIFAIAKFVLFALFVIALPLYAYFQYGDAISKYSSIDDITLLLQENKAAGAFIYIGLQLLQIVISIIPSNLVQFAAGYVYGFWLAYFLSLIGAALGTTIVFYISRLLGKEALSLIFGSKFDRFLERANSKRGLMFICAVYLIPGLPNDLMCYVGGVSDLNFVQFLLLSMVMRTPGMMGSILAGSMLMSGNHTALAILITAVLLLTVFGIRYKEKIIDLMNVFYEKITS